jgi:hypothetical protein
VHRALAAHSDIDGITKPDSDTNCHTDGNSDNHPGAALPWRL